MKKIRKAQAGSFESSDILILAEPVNKGEGRKIELDSDVDLQYGERILALINSILDDYHVNDIHLIVNDKGAIEPVICARMETVMQRALNEQQGTLY